MKRGDPKNVVASVQARLVERSRELVVEHQLTLARFGGERLLRQCAKARSDRGERKRGSTVPLCDDALSHRTRTVACAKRRGDEVATAYRCCTSRDVTGRSSVPPASSSLTAARTGNIGVATRAQYLFSGLSKGGVCGAGFIMTGRNRLACFGAREKGTCDNRLTIRRDEVEARV